MSEKTQKILKKYNIPSSLTDSGIGLQEDEVEPQPNPIGIASESSVGCSAAGDKLALSRFAPHPTSASGRQGLRSESDRSIQDGISYEVKEGTPESPSSGEWSKLESRVFKRPPPARSQKKRAKGESPTADEEASPPKLAPAQSPTHSPTSTKDNESNLVSSPTHPRTNCRNAGTLTELNNNSCAEIELVSLIEEQIPRYKLRADTITDFAGYDNADWINAPLLPLDEPLDLAPELIEETLNYFILCADRLTQMTRTYDDTDALTRLLEEKERDLELAALIGKSLLEEKRALQERIEALEQELQVSQEAVTQLRHDLTKKNSLLSIYMEGEEEGLLGEEAPASLDLLHKKINELENENERLKFESQSWTEDLAVEEERETELINECVRELNEKNKAAAKLQEELAKKTEAILKQQEEITQLLGQQVDLQKKLRDYSIENETLRVNLEVMSETQQELTLEISDSKDKYNTLLGAFQELQEAVRQRRQRTSTGSVCSIGVGGGPLPTGAAASNQSQQSQSNHSSIQNKNFSQGAYGAYTKYINPDSLAAELSMSLRTDNSEGYHSDDRALTASTSNSSPRPPSRRPPGSSGANGRRPISGEFDATSDEGESSFPESYHTDDDSQYSSLSSIGLNPVCGKHPMGLDLSSPMKGMMPQSRSFYDLDEDPTSRCRTPDSILSGFNGFSSGSTTSSMRRYRMPDKLELIKRLEGSRTLHRWRRLATPTPLGLAGLEEETEGIKTRTVPKSPPAVPKNSLPKPPSSLDITSFLEEIDRAQDSPLTLPGKSFVDSSCIYTYSNSNVLHPDATFTTMSLGPTKMATTAGKSPSPVQTTPSVINRSSYLATTTCSVNRGLARILNERGIHAMLPSVLRERNEEDGEKTATSTPAPSPDQTPPGTPPSEDAVDNELDALMPDLVRENRAKGVVLRAYRVDGKSSPMEPAAVRRESLRRTKRGSQELDAQGLVSKLSRLVQWPFQGFVSDGNGNSDRTSYPSVQLSSTVSTTSTLTDTITSVIPIVSNGSTAMSSVTGTRTTSCLSSPSIPSVSALCSTTSFGAAVGKPTAWMPIAGPGLGTGNAPTLTPAMRMPLARAPNPLLQINAGRGRPIGTVSSMRNMRKGALM